MVEVNIVNMTNDIRQISKKKNTMKPLHDVTGQALDFLFWMVTLAPGMNFETKI